MKWIELNDGNLVNLENVEAIYCDPLTCRVLYWLTSGHTASERFAAPEQTKARYNEIKMIISSTLTYYN